MDDISSEVRRYLRYLRRYWWVLVAGGVIGAVSWVLLRGDAGLAGSTRVRVTLVGERWSGVSSGTFPGTLFGEDPDALAVNVARVSSTEELTELTAGTDVAPGDVSFLLDGRRVLVEIGGSLESSTTVGNRIASRLTELRSAGILQPVDTATTAAQERLDSLNSEIATSPVEADRAALVSQAAEISTELSALHAAAARVPQEVKTEVLKEQAVSGAASRSDSRSLLMAIVFIVSGVAIAGVAVIFWSLLDRRILTRRDSEAVLGEDSLLGVLPAQPSSAEIQAVASAIAQCRLQSSDVALVGLGGRYVDSAIGSLSEATGITATDLGTLLDGSVPSACIVVLPVGKVSDRELTRTLFVLDRAGVQTVRSILCEARQSLDVLD